MTWPPKREECRWIATAERCRQIDRSAAADYGIATATLMERAGGAVFDVVAQLSDPGARIAVLCGRGNNGGDGLVVARLAVEHGHAVECLVAAAEADLAPDAATQLSISRERGLQPVFFGEQAWSDSLGSIGDCDLAVDALLGTGATGEISGAIREAILALNASGIPVVAVDVPSGIETDTGQVLGDAVRAVRTVTFGLPKPCLLQGEGLERCGLWSLADIGFPEALLSEPTQARLLGEAWVRERLPGRIRASHKGANGHVLVVAGSDSMPGAAILAARGAIRAGAGLVTLASTDAVCRAAAANLPEVLLMPLPGRDGAIDPAAAHAIRDRASRCDAAIFGPGLGQLPSVAEFLALVWDAWELPCVVDADALNFVAKGLELPPGPCVMTPHPGEMGRLLRSSIAEVQEDRLSSARRAAAQFGKAVLLKGAHSIVAEVGRPLLVNSTGNPGMATGGMGDVLSGVVGALLALRLRARDAAACGMYWHGFAGDLAARSVGPVGFTASEVADRLPMARATIAAGCDRPRD